MGTNQMVDFNTDDTSNLTWMMDKVTEASVYKEQPCVTCVYVYAHSVRF